jgi:menaquinone-dependent protoporphyrinogen oxidase
MTQKKVLVTYGSWLGSTREVAERIGEVLRRQGAQVDVIDGRTLKSAAGYDGILIGTAVRAGMLPGGARRAVRKVAATAQGAPVAGFVVCLAITDEKIEDRETTSRAYLTKHTEKAGLKLVDVQPFAGAVLAQNARGFMKMVTKSMAEQTGDKRDWSAIESWAQAVFPKLLP